MNNNTNMSKRYEHKIPEGYEAKIEGDKVIIELKESDDERTRNEIIAFIEQAIHRGGGTLVEKEKEDRWISYLERQKELKPIFRVGDAIIAKDGTCIQKEPFRIERIEDDCYWDGNNSILVCNQDDFQLIECHPAEWGDDDEGIKDAIISDLELIPGCVRVMEDADALEREVSWLESLSKRFNFQLKQEWSEEDEKCIKDIVDCLEYLKKEDTERQYNGDRNANPKRYTDMIAKLKSLRPQPQGIYKTAIESILEMCNSCNLKKQFSARAMNFWAKVKIKCEDALQACQAPNEPHWKPSEGQIKALEYFIRSWGESGTMSPQNPTLCAAKSLLNDLQKLL